MKSTWSWSFLDMNWNDDFSQRRKAPRTCFNYMYVHTIVSFLQEKITVLCFFFLLIFFRESISGTFWSFPWPRQSAWLESRKQPKWVEKSKEQEQEHGFLLYGTRFSMMYNCTFIGLVNSTFYGFIYFGSKLCFDIVAHYFDMKLKKMLIVSLAKFLLFTNVIAKDLSNASSAWWV